MPVLFSRLNSRSRSSKPQLLHSSGPVLVNMNVHDLLEAAAKQPDVLTPAEHYKDVELLPPWRRHLVCWL